MSQRTIARSENIILFTGPVQYRLNLLFLCACLASVLVRALAEDCVPPAVGLEGWWTGDGTANTLIGTCNGTLEGAATATAVGMVGEAFSFDGVAGYVQIPDSPVLRPPNLTIEAWVLFTSPDLANVAGPFVYRQFIICKEGARPPGGFHLCKERRTKGDVLVFGVTPSIGPAVEVDSPEPVQTGVWYHVAGVRGSDFVQLYVNGQLVAQASVSFAQTYGNSPLYFGTSCQFAQDRKFAGLLDEVSLYDRALDAGQIAAIYLAGSSGKCQPAVAPVIVTQPTNQMSALGSNVAFTVAGAGTPPLNYQWQKGGVALTDNGRISGASSPELNIADLQLTDIGGYNVVINNSAGAVASAVALLTLRDSPPNDAFVNAQAISGDSGSVSGTNVHATKEPGEPNHAANPGGVSVWYAWTAPSDSPATFDTALSGFDTLLAVYAGSTVSNLALVASNNDISASNTRSRLTFTPVPGTVYMIAVDGVDGDTGPFTLRWCQATTPLPDLYVIGSAVNPMISTETFDPSSCAVVEGLVQAGTRRLIRFDTRTGNRGTADLFLGDPTNNPLFEFAPCHAHYHFQNYMAYRLRDAQGQIASIGLKVGFCLEDGFRLSTNSAPDWLYTCDFQGIQKGWGDFYDMGLDGQWVDITDVPDGQYTLELEVNPQGIIQ